MYTTLSPFADNFFGVKNELRNPPTSYKPFEKMEMKVFSVYFGRLFTDFVT
jgi:hypothetical protein